MKCAGGRVETREGDRGWEAERKEAGKSMGLGRGKRRKAEFSEKAGMAWETEGKVRRAETSATPTYTLLSGPLLKIYVESQFVFAGARLLFCNILIG